MSKNSTIFVAGGERRHYLDARYANRHGLIAGATGTGKTVTLQVLAESFSAAGVPVFVADVKGDLSGLSQGGKPVAAPSGTGRWERPGGSRRASPEPTEPARQSRRGSRYAGPARREEKPEKREKGTMERVILADGRRQGLAEAMAKSAMRTVGRRIGSQIVRGVFGSLFKG